MSLPSIIYDELQQAFDYFNKHLFNGKLPPCMITLQREKRTFGYFSKQRFVDPNTGELVDEIALNPSYISVRTIKQTLSTLVHEQVHQFQVYHGKPGRGRYHNKEWADYMEDIGLIPSDTGRPGGKRTGDAVSHYIEPGAAFDRYCDELLTTDYRISWFDRFPAKYTPPEPLAGLDNVGVDNPAGGTTELEFSTELPVDPGLLAPSTLTGNKSNRCKYRCPSCLNQVWGKAGINVLCGEEGCKTAKMLPEGADDQY